MRYFAILVFVISLLGYSGNAHAQQALVSKQHFMDVKVSVVDEYGTPRPDVVVVLSIESGRSGRWLHRQRATNRYGSAILSLEKALFRQRAAVVQILDKRGHQLFTTEAHIRQGGQRLRIEMD